MVCIRNWKLLSWEGAHIEALPKALPRPVGWISALLFGRNDSFLFLPFIPSSLRFMFSCGSCTSLDPDSHGNKESHSLLDWARFPSTERSLLTPFPSFWSGSRQHFSDQMVCISPESFVRGCQRHFCYSHMLDGFFLLLTLLALLAFLTGLRFHPWVLRHITHSSTLHYTLTLSLKSHTLQETNISHLRKKNDHLQKCLGRSCYKVPWAMEGINCLFTYRADCARVIWPSVCVWARVGTHRQWLEDSKTILQWSLFGEVSKAPQANIS